MADLIDRTELLSNADVFTVHTKEYGSIEVIPVDAVGDAPTVDAVPVVHGRWIKRWCDNNMIGHEFEECSECGCSMIDTNQFWDSEYCPHCGAFMEDKNNDG